MDPRGVATATAAETAEDVAVAAPGPEVSARRGFAYHAGLDGIRGVSILGVLANHTGYAPLRHGGFGVDVFFVLSGFLITTLLLEEHAGRGRISLRLFWWRRGARLLPALVAICPVVVVLFLDVRPLEWRQTILGVIPSLLYASSWIRALGISDVGWMGHTWSLSVEEWFYVVWPLLVVAALRFPRHAVKLIAGAAVVAVAYRLTCEQIGLSRDYLYNAPDQRACQLTIGCALGAVLVHEGRRIASHRRALVVAGTAGAIFLGLLFTNLIGQDQTYLWSFFSGETTLLALAAAAVVAVVVLVPEAWLARALSPRWLVWIGRRSYGIYLWHYPLIGLVSPAHGYRGGVLLLSRIGALTGTFGVAAASYRYVERPVILAVRAREAARRRREASASPDPSGGV